MINLEGNYLKIDINTLFEKLDEETQKNFIKSFSVERTVINHVIDYICGDDPDGWFSGYADNNRMEILNRIENTQLRKWVKYNWEPFSELQNRLKEIREKQHIYWKLFHECPEDLQRRILDWMDQQGIECQYTTKQADEDVKRIERMLRDALDKFADKKEGEDD